jgi:serine phosphatase RsbU (regulator of sigma subunit)
MISPPVEVPSLSIFDPEGRRTTHALTDAGVVIGRSADVELRLDHAMVSRRHAEIRRLADGKWTLQDLGSRNGTMVNGKAVGQCVLEDGDIVGVGPFQLTVRLPRGGGARGTRVQSTTLRLADAAPERIAVLADDGQAKLRASHLLRLTDFSRQLLEIARPDERMAALCRLMTQEPFPGHWAAVVRLSEAGEPKMLWDARRAGVADTMTYLSRTVLAALRERRQAVLGSNMPSVPMDLQISVATDGRGIAAVACPLSPSAGDAATEVLYVVLPPECGTEEWLALAELAARQFAQGEMAWAARQRAEAMAASERDLVRARQIQMRLVPTDVSVSGLDVAIGFAPCRVVGGDYVDAVPLADGRLLATVADVCGKGLSAALVAQSLHTLVHSGVTAGLALPRLMSNINGYLQQSLAEDLFVTMAVVVIDPATGAVEYANAGHLPPVVLSAAGGGAPRSLAAAEDLPLRLAESPMAAHADRIEPGETMVLYTDGLTEMRVDGDGGMLGTQGLIDELKACQSAASARELAAGLEARLGALQGPREQGDDRTFIIVRRAQ